MAIKPRLARIVLAVLSSVVLTALVVVPLAFGARSARSDDRDVTTSVIRVANTTPRSAVVSTPDDDGTSSDPTTAADRDEEPSTVTPPRVPTQVLPSTETRDDQAAPRAGQNSGPRAGD